MVIKKLILTAVCVDRNKTSTIFLTIKLKSGECIRACQHAKRSECMVLHNVIYENVCLFVCFWRDSPQWARASSFTRFLDHTQRRTTFGRTPLDE